MMRKLILIIFMVMQVTVTFAQKIWDWEKVINAIIQVESEGNPKAVCGRSVGILQITPILVKDCNEYLKIKGKRKRYTLKDRYNVEKSKEMFYLIQERYNPEHNVEKAIRLWNGGSGYSKKKTNSYYLRVMRNMK